MVMDARRAMGALLLLLGASVIGGWLAASPAIVSIVPGYSPMTANTALCFLASGLVILLSAPPTPRWRALATLAGVFIGAVAGITLIEHALATGAIIDWPAPSAGSPDLAGLTRRMSPPTAAAFLFAAAAFVAGPRVRGRAAGIAVLALTLGVGLVGALGVAGHFVNAKLLYPNYVFVGVALHTAIGLVVLAGAMASLWRTFEWRRELAFARQDDRIAFIGAVILGVVALVAGIASFSILQGRLESIVVNNVHADLAERSEQIQDLLALREIAPRVAAERPAVLRFLLANARDGRGDGAEVRAGLATLLANGFNAVAYYDEAGDLVASGGHFAESPELRVRLQRPVDTELMWQGGVFLVRHRVPVVWKGTPIGLLISEQPLPTLTRLSRSALGLGQSEELVLCNRRGDNLHCFPTQLNPRVFRTGVVNLDGEPFPMTRATRGDNGVVITRDYRGRNVVAAYGPIGDVGLGMVVKVDASDIFQPIREQLQIVVALLAALVAGGTALLRSLVRPLATKLVEAEAGAQSRSAELARAVAAKDSFLATVSHELRTPLNAIIGFTGALLLRLAGPLNAEQEKQLGTVQKSARHLLAVINDMLDLAKIDAGKVELDIEPCACGAIVEEVAASLRPLAESKGLQLDVALPPGEVSIHTDRRIVSQILLNLAGNAIKFTDRGSVGIRLEQRARAIEITVQDTGPGIAAEDQSKLFTAFTQLDASVRRRHEGTGLGLHLSQKLARLLGARITLTSAAGAGSEFTLVLEDA
jgi:signal transduction histidine kinase